MTKRAFDKIAAGLREAIAIARGRKRTGRRGRLAGAQRPGDNAGPASGEHK